jgi:rod shape-determining protein MreB
VRGKGIVLDEPRWSDPPRRRPPRQEDHPGRGSEAKAMLGKVPGNIEAIRPMKDGVIADFTVTEQMLKQFIKMVPRGCSAQPAHHHLRALRLHPGRAPRHPRIGAGRRRQRGLPDRGADGRGHRRRPAGREATGSMVVDIGGGTTEVGVISLGGMVYKGRRAWAATSSTTPSSTTSAATTAC